MGFKGLTVNTDPTAEPHIYAEDDASIYQSILGSDGVLNIGQKFEATVLSNNLVRMADGILCVNGHIGRTAYGLYDDFEIANGQSGVNRNDLIIAKFQTTGTNGIDTYTVEVKQGAAAAEAVDPEITQEDLYQGGKLREYPLYRVRIEGLSIVAVEPLFKIIPTVPELEGRIGELNSDLKSANSEIGVLKTSLEDTDNALNGLKNTFSRFTTANKSGYLILPNGIKMCYGYYLAENLSADSTSGGYSTEITLPITLRSPLVVMATPVFVSGFPRCAAYAVSTSKIKLLCDVNASGCAIHWIAIG